MTASGPATGSSAPRVRPRPRRGRTWRRRARARENAALVALVVATVLVGVLIAGWPALMPLNLMVIPLVLGSVLLGPRQLPWFVVFVLTVFAVDVSRQPEYPSRTIVAIMVVFVLGLIVMLTSFRRSRLGVAGAQGESMLVDLRDRIQRQGELPDLPPGWYAESVLKSAGGTKFAGDFVVASRSADGTRLDLAVVDVSGKGADAGTRALLLSGAFSGLLGALPHDRFLPAANDYLLRQDWDEGFATAVHLSLEFATGHFELRTAGHPPAVQFLAGSGRWTVHHTEGPILGLIPEAEFVVSRGTMRVGDAALLYTDG
ncbi:PP2C family protein-serine/threonine phosphatase, partial [Nocardioides sp.]|uniref:PP2C family protein-serine/threonine phosphatase n=1 Tax=Nocardioides sp. TaxID=35761 RepID=UPI0027361C98